MTETNIYNPSSMAAEITITKGMTLWYKMKTGEKVFKRVIKEVSPNGKCILADENDGKGEIWLVVANLEILDGGKPV